LLRHAVEGYRTRPPAHHLRDTVHFVVEDIAQALGED
jgi:hypothetical protein